MTFSISNKLKNHSFFDYLKHETKRHSLIKYIGVLIILILYFIIISNKYGKDEGILITVITWSFFVFCSPIAIAGFLLDFPIRILTGLKMIFVEIIVWFTAIIINISSLIFYSEIYEKTIILKIFKEILINPFPYWSIIIVCLIGTFISIYFADELIDVSKHEHRKKFHKHLNKYQIILMTGVILLVIVLYDILITQMNLEILL